MAYDIRSSDVFLKADIAALLRALVLTVQLISADNSGEFARGYLTALTAVAVALNIEPIPDVVATER